MMYDVAIIGAGICGCSLAYELSKYQAKVIVLEKENDVSLGTTKANSAIIHAGYDPKPGTKMAKYNVDGNAYTKELCEKLDVPYKQIGSLVVAFSESEMETVCDLYDRGVQNGVPGLRVIGRDELLSMEPNLSQEARGALYAPTAGVVSPWELAIALAETAAANGVTFALNHEVLRIEKKDCFHIATNQGKVETKLIVNCAGVYADLVDQMAEEGGFSIQPNKGEYYLLDKCQGNLVSHVIFQCPNENGKGVLVSPTVHGNLIVGPDAQNTNEQDDVSTSLTGLAFVREKAAQSVPAVDFRESIRNFAGVRAKTGEEDFIIGESGTKGFFNIAGIQSPGLSSAAAIALDMARMLTEAGMPSAVKRSVVDSRKVVRFRDLNEEEKAEAIKKTPLYGQVICRCETITEGEIVDALHRPIVPVSIDGVKRRAGAGMGRCQGGFCGPRVQEIIARELGVSQKEVLLDKAGTVIILGETKQGGSL